MTDELLLRYGVIGTGMMGVEHILNVLALDDTSVTAIADPDAGSRDAGLAAAGVGTSVYTNHHDLLADDSIDAVVVATPNFTHLDVMRDVLATGKHVICEKPLATTTADCKTMIELADGYPGVVWVGLEYRYMPAVQALINEAHAGVAGDVKMVTIREHRFPFLEKIGDWNRFSKNTGGTLVEKTCHYFDLMNLIIGQRPVQVYASGGQSVNHLDEIYDGERSDILDNAYVTVDYPDGVRAMLDLCMFAEATKDQEEISVVGDVGKLDARVPTSELHVGIRSGEGWPDIGQVETRSITNEDIRHTGLHHGASYLEHVDFAYAIRNNTPPLVTLEDGLWSVAMGEAANRSIAENRPVALTELI
ncbi:MAG: Gfo/Idh/MocA family oxidoreductase [Acidimicrobiales bacterium]|nr:Gfo/Idh/MocA family oxidoreductase [Acidimicrobiales bacterium]RZV46276.1 MAG: Gfo/Idh/MocA family oxidoreductase [Acidimicrobiales bacterium]